MTLRKWLKFKDNVLKLKSSHIFFLNALLSKQFNFMIALT